MSSLYRCSPKENILAKQSGVTFPPAFPPKMMNLAWRLPKGGGVHDLEELGIDFAKHLAEGPCPCFMVVLLPAHSGTGPKLVVLDLQRLS